MLKTFSLSALVAVSSALKLQVQDFKGLGDYSAWETTTDKFYAELNKSGTEMFEDADFPYGITSLGAIGGDAARGAGGSDDSAISWDRLSTVYGSKAVMFSGKEIYSTAMQGQIGDCYLISTLVALDARPGALEELFITTTKNDRGIYGMKFYIGGKMVYVHVDDYVPVVKRYEEVDGQGVYDKKWPTFGRSVVHGEMWPSIAEKAWAKIVGTYGAIEGGSNMWVLSHLTNDPYDSVKTRGVDPADNQLKQFVWDGSAAGDKLWANLKHWSEREYLIFAGTDDNSWVKNHAYAVLLAAEYSVGTSTKKMLKMRNPWGKSDWSGAYAEGTAEYTALNTALTAKGEAS
jgi:hypothetical protein